MLFWLYVNWCNIKVKIWDAKNLKHFGSMLTKGTQQDSQNWLRATYDWGRRILVLIKITPELKWYVCNLFFLLLSLHLSLHKSFSSKQCHFSFYCMFFFLFVFIFWTNMLLLCNYNKQLIIIKLEEQLWKFLWQNMEWFFRKCRWNDRWTDSGHLKLCV
jgi:hypothetical protein